MTKYIFVIGGVMSGVGKGVATASLGKILASRGYNVSLVKIDPYLNVDAGTMNPVEHGEVFVTEDGLETDQDLGNYERFLDRNMHACNSMTTGSVFKSVIERERDLKYEGKCVETIPHVTEEVQKRIKKAASETGADFLLVEIGGTVGEYKNMLFLEAASLTRLLHPQDTRFILVSYLPIPKMVGEMKTKPTQHAARTLNSAGIQPDFIIARSEVPLDEPRKKKIAIFCNVAPDDVISAPDITSIYEIPVNFEKDRIGNKILKKFRMKPKKAAGLTGWNRLVRKIRTVSKPVKIGIIGKYFNSGNFVIKDAYLSVIEATKHAAWHWDRKPEIQWLDSEIYEKNPRALKALSKYDGIIVPGGFGDRGVEGKIKAIGYVRKYKIPFLGLCYGMQLATIEFARNVCGLKNAHTTEVNKNTRHPVIDIMEEQKQNLEKSNYGASMRLGAYRCVLTADTLAQEAYGKKEVWERHRHRYELNNNYRQILESRGLVVSGVNPEKNLIEIIEIKNHPFFVGSQFHPEFLSRPLRPHPLFRDFVKASIRK